MTSPGAPGSSGPFEHQSHIDADTLLRRVVEIISNAKSMPLSNSVIISKDEVLELLEDAVGRLPDELRQARWMLKEREEFLAKVEREADEILDAARIRAERMVQRTEIVLERTMKTVQAGREKLAATPLPPADAELGLAGMVAAGPGADMSAQDDAFFDQDRT